MIAGIVLAAGEGARFGGPKQLAELEGTTLLRRAVDAQLTVPAVDDVVVVLGARAAEIRAALGPASVRFAVADDWRAGAGASLRAGLAAALDADAWVVTLADQPLMTADLVARFAAEDGTCRAAFAGAPGHPVRLEPAAARAIRAGAQPRAMLADARRVECGVRSANLDVDTPEDLEAARHAARAVIHR